MRNLQTSLTDEQYTHYKNMMTSSAGQAPQHAEERADVERRWCRQRGQDGENRLKFVAQNR